MELYILSDSKECKEAIRLLKSGKVKGNGRLRVVDIDKAGISSTDLQMDFGSSEVPLLDTSENIISGLTEIRHFVMNNHNHF